MVKKINWPTAFVAVAGLLLLGLVAFFGKDIGLTDAAHSQVLAALGTIGSVVLAFMKAALETEDEGPVEDGPDDEKDEED